MTYIPKKAPKLGAFFFFLDHKSFSWNATLRSPENYDKIQVMECFLEALKFQHKEL